MSGDFAHQIPRKNPLFFYISDLLREFIGKTVLVEAYDLRGRGILVNFTEGNGANHIPVSLILKDEHGFIIIRNWNLIRKGN